MTSVTKSEEGNRFMDAVNLSTLVQNMNVLLHKVDSKEKRRQMIESSTKLLQITLFLREKKEFYKHKGWTQMIECILPKIEGQSHLSNQNLWTILFYIFCSKYFSQFLYFKKYLFFTFPPRNLKEEKVSVCTFKNWRQHIWLYSFF